MGAETTAVLMERIKSPIALAAFCSRGVSVFSLFIGFEWITEFLVLG